MLPKLTKTDADKITKHLIENSGVEALEDLKEVEAEDLKDLKPIQVRKLIRAWKPDSKYISHFLVIF